MISYLYQAFLEHRVVGVLEVFHEAGERSQLIISILVKNIGIIRMLR